MMRPKTPSKVRSVNSSSTTAGPSVMLKHACGDTRFVILLAIGIGLGFVSVIYVTDALMDGRCGISNSHAVVALP
jgi:hypothetical protein